MFGRRTERRAPVDLWAGRKRRLCSTPYKSGKQEARSPARDDPEDLWCLDFPPAPSWECCATEGAPAFQMGGHNVSPPPRSVPPTEEQHWHQPRVRARRAKARESHALWIRAPAGASFPGGCSPTHHTGGGGLARLRLPQHVHEDGAVAATALREVPRNAQFPRRPLGPTGGGGRPKELGARARVPEGHGDKVPRASSKGSVQRAEGCGWGGAVRPGVLHLGASTLKARNSDEHSRHRLRRWRGGGLPSKPLAEGRFGTHRDCDNLAGSDREWQTSRRIREGGNQSLRQHTRGKSDLTGIAHGGGSPATSIPSRVFRKRGHDCGRWQKP